MSRYRPPAKPRARYITPEGKRRLLDELSRLWRQERPRVTQAVAEAAAQGDRSENAEYIYGKKQLRQIDSRIRFLQKRLDELVVVEHPPEDRKRVFFGAWVSLEDEDGEQAVYRLVGPDEIDPARGWISIDSPLARALLKHRVGDDVLVRLPAGEKVYHILEVRYAQD